MVLSEAGSEPCARRLNRPRSCPGDGERRRSNVIVVLGESYRASQASWSGIPKRSM